MKELGKFLKDSRKKKNFTLREVSKRLQSLYENDRRYWISDSHLCWLEQGKTDLPNPFVLMGLAIVYDVSYHVLYQLAGYEPASEEEYEYTNPNGLLQKYLN